MGEISGRSEYGTELIARGRRELQHRLHKKKEQERYQRLVKTKEEKKVKSQVLDLLVRKGKVMCLEMHNPKLFTISTCSLWSIQVVLSPSKASAPIHAMKYPPQNSDSSSNSSSSRMQMYTKMEAGWRLMPSFESRCMWR